MQYTLVATVGQAVSDVIVSLSSYSIISLKIRSTIVTPSLARAAQLMWTCRLSFV